MLRIKTPSFTVLQGGPLSARLPASRVPSKNFLANHQLDVHFCIEFLGFDHGVGHSLLLLYDAKAPNCQKSKEFKGLGHYPCNTSLSVF